MNEKKDYTMTLLVGDVHGKFERYKTLIKNHQNTIQVGDMGLGFKNLHGDYVTNPPYDLMVKQNARFIRGNHDNPIVCKNHKQWIPDGTIEGNVMFIGGAWSIDYALRTEGYSWWENEQCSQSKLGTFVDLAIQRKPSVIISHDCPMGIVPAMFLNHSKEHIVTRTGQALESIRQLAPPKLWVFGHWHESRDVMVEGTRFVCLAELEAVDFDLGSY